LFVYVDDEEDTETLAEARRFHASRVTVTVRDKRLRQQWKTVPSWERMGRHVKREVQARQVLNADHALMYFAEKHSVSWLVHIDADELFYDPSEPLDVRGHFARASAAGVGAFDYRNHEAVPESSSAGDGDTFRECTLFRRNPCEHAELEADERERQRCVQYWEERHAMLTSTSTSTSTSGGFFVGYSNGKSAVRVWPGAHAGSNHQWIAAPALGGDFCHHSNVGFDGSRPRIRSDEPPCILHYIDCGFPNWWRKYELLGRFADSWFAGEVPIGIPLHLASRDVCSGGDEAAARAFYNAAFVLANAAEASAQEASGACFRLAFVRDTLAAVDADAAFRRRVLEPAQNLPKPAPAPAPTLDDIDSD